MDDCIALELILVDFDLKKVELTLDQKKEYEDYNAQRAPGKNLKRIFFKKQLTEKEFYMGKLKQKQALDYFVKTVEECNEKGHIEKQAIMTNHGVYCVCERCGLGYKRRATQQEYRSWDEMMHTIIH